MIVPRISCAIENDPKQKIDHPNWVRVKDVRAYFDISHRGSTILLKFLVLEPQVRAVNTEYNSAVWEDSCVEFFISLEGDKNYYNFEINAIGTILGAYGPDRHQRDFLPPGILELIEVEASLGRKAFKNLEGSVQWELDIVLPVKAFCYHSIYDIAGNSARGNFYKCGDKLDKPHFLSWNPVLSKEPDFHLPEFFAPLEFK